jgi:signal transduction histidine kinase
MKGLRERLLEKAAANHLDGADSEALRDYYQSVLDSVGSVVYTVNRDLRLTGVNRQWDAFALTAGGKHLTSEHILGTHLLDQMRGAPLERWRTVCQQILDGELPRYLDEVASQEPSAWRHYSLSATPLRNSQGEIFGITFVASNITQLKKAEHEMFQRLIEIRGLRQVAQTAGTWCERRTVYKQVTSDIAHLFSAERCVIFLWDEHTGNLQAQQPAYGLSGRRLAELALDMGHPTDPDSLWPVLEEKDYILLNGDNDLPANTADNPDNVGQLAAMLGVLRVSARIRGAILVAGRDRPFSNDDGQLLAIVAVPTALSIENTDLNERLLDRTQQLSTARGELDRLIKLKEGIRTPLSVIRGYLELLREGAMGPVPEPQQPTLHVVLDKTQAIISLINRIAPPCFPHDATRYERIDLADLVRRVLERRLSTIRQTGLRLVTELPAPHDEESITVGDPDMLFRVFDALVENAIRFSPDGGTLHVSLHVAGDILYVEVTDSGAGIPTDQLLHIWKPQRRTEYVDTVNLAEVRRIVEGHGGQVWAESTPGQGSTFHVVLRKLDR